MPIGRTPWIDDDGTGTTGTVINNAEKQALYNQIDAACAFPKDVNLFDAPQYFRGAASGAASPGRIKLIDRAGPTDYKEFEIVHVSGSLSIQALNDIETTVISVPLRCDRSGAVGVAGGIWQGGRPAAMGAWESQPFNPGNFAAQGAGGNIWTITNTFLNAYTRVGTTLTWSLHIDPSVSSVTGAGMSGMLCAYPAGLAAYIRGTSGIAPSGVCIVQTFAAGTILGHWTAGPTGIVVTRFDNALLTGNVGLAFTAIVETTT